MATQEHIAEQLKVLLSEELKVISYKWLARKFGLPCNVAKQTLFAFLEQHRGKVKATYLLAGWTTTEPRQHTVQLVDSEHLSTRRSSLDPVTSMHVYSLQPTQPKDASDLWNHDAIQTAELFQELRLGQTNCLADNRWSAVKCLEAKHDPSLAKRAPTPAAAGPSTDGAAAGHSKAAPKAAPTSAVNQIAGIMAGSARQGGVATASVAVKGSGSSSIQGGDEAVPMERDSGTTATAPAGAPPLTGRPSGAASAAPVPGGGKKKGSKSRLANMWSKAPAVKEKPQQPAKSKAQSAPAVDADAALRSAQQAGSSSDSEEEDVLPMKRSAQQRGKRIDEEEEDEDDSAVKPAGRQAKKAKTSDSGKAAGPSRGRRAVQDDSEDEQEEPVESAVNKAPSQAKGKSAAPTKKKTARAAKQASTKKAPASKPKSKQIKSDEEDSDADIEVSVEEEEQGPQTQGEAEVQEEGQGKSQAGKGKNANKRAAANKPGNVKAGDATGPKRRKVTRTTINDRGEEVTEQVWEDSQEVSASQQTDGQPDAAPAANSPAGKSPEKAPADDALKEQPGNGVANAGKPTAAKPSKPSKPVAAAAKKGSGKAAVKDQRGIMSFFAKK